VSEIENFIKLSKEQNDACLPIVLWSEEAKALIDEVETLRNRIAELEAENNRLAELLHNELSSVEIATDLGNKRWVALNDIYENGEKHNTNWCKRKAQEGLGIK
jgi:predicted nuclease with TOPRIM domain